MFKTPRSRRYKQLLVALRDARESRGITQVQLAQRLRTTQTLVSKVERGARRLDVVELEIWCRALGVDLGEFVSSY